MNLCDEVLVQHDRSGCVFLIGRNTRFGKVADGGTRMKGYASIKDAKKELSELTTLMVMKTLILGEHREDFTGGKGIIIGNPDTDKTPDLLERYGEMVESLGGAFTTGADINISQHDVEIMSRKTRYVTGFGGPLGDTGETTAFGVVVGMQTIARLLWGRDNIQGISVAVQGVGDVGLPLVKLLLEAGVSVTACDIIKERAQMAEALGARIVPAGEIYDTAVDVFSPNACGGVLSQNILPKCRIVLGAANGPLVSKEADKFLFSKGIIYVPDYVVNIGGVFHSICEQNGVRGRGAMYSDLEDLIMARLEEFCEISVNKRCTLLDASNKYVSNLMRSL